MGIKYTARSHPARPTSVWAYGILWAFLVSPQAKSQLDYGSLAWLLAVVMRIGNVLITSFRSHCRAHPLHSLEKQTQEYILHTLQRIASEYRHEMQD